MAKASTLLRQRTLGLLALTLLLSAPAHAQVTRRNLGSGTASGSTRDNGSNTGNGNPAITPGTALEQDTSATKGLIFATDIPDTVLREKVFFFPYESFRVKINQLDHPSLDPTGCQFNDALDALNGNYYLSTGVIGHPHLALFPTFADGLAYSLQGDEHEGYAKSPYNIHFYQTQTPYSVLSYGSSLNKDYTLRVGHAQNIVPGWNVAFDYRLTNPEGVFAHSAARNHYLDATTNYFSPDSRLQVWGGFIFQRFTVDENGGLSDDSYFTSGRQTNQAGLPMTYGTAGSVHLRHNAFGRITCNLVQQVEAIRTRETYNMRQDTVRADSIVTVVDTLVHHDTIPVGRPRVLNAGVIGLEAAYHRRKRAAYLPDYSDSTLWHEASASLFWTNDAYPDHRWRNPLKITLGITPKYISTQLLGDTLEGLSLFNPYARLEWHTRLFTLKAEAEADGMMGKLFPYMDRPSRTAMLVLDLPLDSAGCNTLSASIDYEYNLPEVRMLHTAAMPLRHQHAHRAELRYTREADGGHVPMLDLTLRATYLSHHLWYDTALVVHQGETGLWLYQAALTARLQLGWLHLDMQQLLQHSTDDQQVAVPLWASKNSLYADMHLFHRALRLQVGVDLRYHTRFHADAYHPASGLFVAQSEQEVGGYIWGDVFINLQVKRASIYLKAGHLNALWETRPAYMMLLHYPGQRFGLSWGLTWKFFD